MSRILAFFWPRSLAARLMLLLLLALAGAQLGLIAVLRWREDNVVEAIGHGQALAQTVALVRLLGALPASDAPTLTAAFGSRVSCALLSDSAPPPHAMSLAESRLADIIQIMLHGRGLATPHVVIDASAPRTDACNVPDQFSRPPEVGDGGHIREHHGDGPVLGLLPFTTVAVTVRVSDGHWLTTRTGVEMPGGWNQATLVSFIVSSLAVAGAAFAAMRTQTKSLRALADASERFGRGESVPPLPGHGPIEVATASQAFNTMQDRLSNFLRDRLRLLASIGHDLRTPLTTLRLKAEFIEDAEVRDGIVATIEELTTICESTLAFSRAEASTETTRNVDLAALVRGVAQELVDVEQDVIALPSAPVVYPCRPIAIKRAVRNLAENAVRYGDRAWLGIEQRPGSVVLLVDDDGPGLPADSVEEAFKPFVRLETSRNTDTGGLGLGLAIARSIVQAHGGTLTLANRPEGGLRAEISLPRKGKF